MAARTLNTIYNQMIAEKNTFSYLDELQPNADSLQTFLQSLSSKSKVAVWRLIFYVTALAIWTHEKLLDILSKEIEQRAIDVIPGTTQWYRQIALEFQDGDGLFWTGKKYIYSPVVPANRLIIYAAALEINNQVIIKVAKDNSGIPGPLTTDEKARFVDYLNLRKYAGTNTDVFSLAADTVNITASIVYDPLILDSSGILISDGVSTPILDALNAYFYDLGTSNFNGKLRVIDMIDALQKVPGFVTIAISSFQSVTPGPPVNILAQPGQQYQSVAGHIIIDTATLTYITI